MTKGFIFKCSDRSESECLNRSLFGTDRLAGDEVLSLEPGDKLFLLNVESDRLTGVFQANSKGAYNLVPEAWRGRYRYQVEVQSLGQIRLIGNAKETLSALRLNSHQLLHDFEVAVLNVLLSPDGQQLPGTEEPSPVLVKQLAKELASARAASSLSSQEDDKPTLESTTLWDYPKQSYGRTPKGDNKYAGVTPAFIIWNLVKRYTAPGDLVLDPMCGSGTTIDVCREEGRRVIGYDIVSVRPDVLENDVRGTPCQIIAQAAGSLRDYAMHFLCD